LGNDISKMVIGLLVGAIMVIIFILICNALLSLMTGEAKELSKSAYFSAMIALSIAGVGGLIGFLIWLKHRD